VLQSAGTTAVKLPVELPAAMIRIDGVGGAPDVTLKGPGGKVISTASPPADRNVVVAKFAAENATYVALRKPAGGRWTLRQDGTVKVKDVVTSHGLSAPRISARVTGKGNARRLVYRVAGGAGSSIAFVERHAHAYHVLGTTLRSSGSLRFTPAAGPKGRRQIVAEISRNGAPVRKLVVATYVTGGTTHLARPGSVRFARRGTVLVVRWRAVPGAARYAVALTLPGARTMSVVRGTTALLTGVTSAGRVSVAALGPDGSRGPVATVHVPAPPTPAQHGRSHTRSRN
jgi:hypothetical protein